ncbi:MAG TPA: AAA family ATPase, partial [Polyangia bacterium]
PQVKQHKTKRVTIALPALQASTSGAPDPSRVESPFVVGLPAEEPEHFFGRRRELEEIRRALAQRQAVQLVGETRMGKTSLLGRVSDLLPKDRPVVHLNAKGLAGVSSKDLVLAIARSLDRRPEIERRTKDERTDSFLATIELLAPCAVLLDEADAIAQGGHGFDKRFFEQCRTLCQHRRLIWVSVSHSELGALFQQRGLVSRFLNDSKIVHVGQLDSDAADALVSVLGPALAGRARELAGGFPLGLQWLGHELWRNGDQPFLAENYANAMRIHFAKWWERLEGDERRLLRRACAGVARTRLGDGERSKLAALVQRGLAEQVDGTFGVPGAGWRRFVEEGE